MSTTGPRMRRTRLRNDRGSLAALIPVPVPVPEVVLVLGVLVLGVLGVPLRHHGKPRSPTRS